MPIKKLISEQSKLADAANLAVTTIASAAAEATKVIAGAAAEASKVVASKGSLDHDLLIELKTRMDSIRDDIKDLKDGTSTKIAEHENRIFALESAKGKQSVLISAVVVLGGIVTAMVVFHLFGIKIL
jgi:hypothetical protein